MGRPSGPHGNLGKKEVEIEDERGAPTIHPNDPSLAGPEQEKDGTLGVSGGQPDVPPSGRPNSNNSSPEPKVKILFELGTRHFLRAFASYFQFRVKSDFWEQILIYIIVHVHNICIGGSHHHTFTLQLCNFVFFIYFQYVPSWREVIHHSTL